MTVLERETWFKQAHVVEKERMERFWEIAVREMNWVGSWFCW